MATLVKAASRNDIPPGEGRCVEVAGRTIALFNLQGSFFAVDNTCVHRGGPLGEGAVEGEQVVCPWHGWRYDLKTGRSITNPAKSVATYPVRLQGDDVMVEVG